MSHYLSLHFLLHFLSLIPLCKFMPFSEFMILNDFWPPIYFVFFDQHLLSIISLWSWVHYVRRHFLRLTIFLFNPVSLRSGFIDLLFFILIVLNLVFLRVLLWLFQFLVNLRMVIKLIFFLRFLVIFTRGRFIILIL